LEVLRLNLPSGISNPPWREVIVISCHHNNLIGREAIELRTACQVWARVFDSGFLVLDAG
jgi:hypothetical protein